MTHLLIFHVRKSVFPWQKFCPRHFILWRDDMIKRKKSGLRKSERALLHALRFGYSAFYFNSCRAPSFTKNRCFFKELGSSTKKF
ncbi:hypothetical protein EUGRSUZ_C03966 [Eucalyptus grandis]|uniref:Uncharacterized protein n=2 Tax=Eucalyptus grandis TaxID=71139 RepID=A0ACC3LK79_EUCGR|nr:hypothetical protein EUGRSUZ_C03966 [Eucalyptus grandis]